MFYMIYFFVPHICFVPYVYFFLRINVSTVTLKVQKKKNCLQLSSQGQWSNKKCVDEREKYLIIHFETIMMDNNGGEMFLTYKT